jgi:hypothetical protein
MTFLLQLAVALLSVSVGSSAFLAFKSFFLFLRSSRAEEDERRLVELEAEDLTTEVVPAED